MKAYRQIKLCHLPNQAPERNSICCQHVIIEIFKMHPELQKLKNNEQEQIFFFFFFDKYEQKNNSLEVNPIFPLHLE